MLSLEKSHARLVIPEDQDFGEVSESIRMIFQLCRVNALSGALVVSLQSPTSWRSSIRVGIRFGAGRGTLLASKLALVVQGSEARQRDDVCAVAKEAGVSCRVFEDERAALAWLKEPSRREA